jgi:hypothetical protein
MFYRVFPNRIEKVRLLIGNDGKGNKKIEPKHK